MNKMKYILTTLLAVTIAAPVFAQNINAQKDEFSKALQSQIAKAAAKEKNTLNLKNPKIEVSAEKTQEIIALMRKSGKFTEKDVEVVKHLFENNQADLALLLIVSKIQQNKEQASAKANKQNFSFNMKDQKIEISAEKAQEIVALMEQSGKFTEQDVKMAKQCFENDQADLALLLIISKLLKDKQDQDAVAVQKTEESSWLSAVFGGKYPGETDDSYRCRMEMKKYPAAQPFK